MVSSLDSFKANLGDFGFFCTEVGDLKPRWVEGRDRQGVPRRVVQSIEHGDKQYAVTPRFMHSLGRRFGISPSFFTYFRPDEVFERIQDRHPRSRIRMAIEGDMLLAASNPSKAVVGATSLCKILDNLETGEVTEFRYGDGVVKTTHKMSEPGWEVHGDTFKQTFTLETPIDGYGTPAIYLSVIRQICSNGMIGYAPAFRSEVQLGRGHDLPEIPLSRAIESFNNEEGFQGLRQRLEAAGKSSASVREVNSLAKTISRSLRQDANSALLTSAMTIHEKLTELAGDVARIYSVASPASISSKKQRLLPMQCTVYDLLNLATELATHHRSLFEDVRRVDAWVGQMIVNEYDLEGTCDEGMPTRAFYLNN